MSEIAPAKCRVEIFRGPGFFDDHFCKGWSLTSGSWAKDGDVVIVSSSESTDGKIEKNIPNLSSTIYSEIQVRITEVLGGGAWRVRIIFSDLTYLDPWGSQTDTGIFTAQLTLGKTITLIRLYSDLPGAGKSVKFDYVALCKYTLLIPFAEGDVVEDLTITRPLLNSGVSGAKLTLHNFEGVFNGAINKHDVIIIWLARDSAYLGDPAYKAFGGRIVNSGNQGRGQGAFFITLDCHGHAYELINPPNLIQKLYSSINGRTIIEEALSVCSYVTRHPSDSKWFDAGGATGSTDDRINSTHDCEYDEVIPKTVIDEICEKANNPAGVKGFDIAELPSGVLVGHLRNSLDFTSPIASITPETYSKSEDIHPIKTRIPVYGKAEKTAPSNPDDWCESLTNWTTAGYMTLSLNADRKVGSYSIQCYNNAPPTNYLWMQRTFSSLKAYMKKHFRSIKFWFKADSDAALSKIRVNLLAPDLSNCFSHIIPLQLKNEWLHQELGTGPFGDFELIFGSPNWENIQGISIELWSESNATWVQLRIDELHFAGARFYGLADPPTENYGIRFSEPIIDDALRSDAECSATSQSLRDFLKDPLITLENVLTDGDYRYCPGDRQRVIVSNDNYDAYSRIIEIQHKVVGVTWDAILKLSNEPQYRVHSYFLKTGRDTRLLKRIGGGF